ncbi:hypothetical protein GC194_11615 [bacterium]|nr:hypothetical protein [bacterium]
MNIEVRLKHYLAAHHDAVYSIAVINQNEFYTGGGDGMLLHWNLNQPDKAQVLARTDGSVYAIKLLADETLLVATNSGFLYGINPKTKQLISEKNLGKTIFSIALLSADTAVAGLADGHVVAVSLPHLAEISRTRLGHSNIRELLPHPHDDDKLFASSSDGGIYVVNKKLELVNHLPSAHSDAVFALAFNQKNQLISGGKDALLCLWNMEKYGFNELNRVPAHLFAINQIAPAPAGNLLATASRDKSIKFWEADTLLLRKVLDRSKIPEASSHSVNRIAWLNTHHIVAAGDDRVVRVYEVQITEPA